MGLPDDKERVVVILPKTMLADLKMLAIKDDRKLSNYIRNLLIDYLAQPEVSKKLKQIKKGT